MSEFIQPIEQELQHCLGRVVFGMEDVIHGLCVALIAGGHVLLEGVPGLGKTLLAQSMAAHRGGSFKRIQCTSDLLPSDITGVHVYNTDKHSFEFVPGPLFADLVLVDEVNRTSPKTQSALLEAMEERTVTIDRKTYVLPEDHFVIASQNPHEFEGTYPLPESQLDRFLIRLRLQYPGSGYEQQVLKAYDGQLGRNRHGRIKESPLPSELLVQARAQSDSVQVSDPIYDYAVAVAQATRAHGNVSLGLSTRGALALMRCARAEALLTGAEFVTPDHLKAVAEVVIAHRLVLSADASLEGLSAEAVVRAVLDQVPVPRG